MIKLLGKYLILILLIIFSFSFLFAEEDPKIDSLESIIEQSNNKQEKETIYNQIIEEYLSLSAQFEEKRDFDKALLYYKKYNSLYDSLFFVQKERQLEEIHLKYQTAKHNKIIELLKKDQEIKKEKNAIQNRHIKILLIMVFILFLIFILLFILKRRSYITGKVLVEKNIELTEKREHLKSRKKEKPSTKVKIESSQTTLTEQQKAEIKEMIISSMEDDKLYLQVDLTINSLSEHLKINRTYLSRIINESFNKNFNTYVNEYRINEAMRLLIINKNYTIEGVANEVGFKSKSSFNLAFKKYSGITPSFFIKKSISTK